MSITGSAVLETRRRLHLELLAVMTLGQVYTAMQLADAYAEAARQDERAHFTAGRIGG